MLIEPGTAFSIKGCGVLWRMKKKVKIQTFAGKYISMFHRLEWNLKGKKF